MGESLSLADYRKKRVRSDVEIMRDRFMSIVRGINTDWQRAERRGRLDEWIAEELDDEVDDYTTDLNLLNQIETGIGVRTMIFHPYAAYAGNTTGFAAGFRYQDEVFATPAMRTEAEARAFNILLYLRMMTDGKGIS